ncbi:MAG TPA: CapA family protein [Anaerolineales bacterium]|nr:CapA family protein [Anaerolineales bacterium]
MVSGTLLAFLLLILSGCQARPAPSVTLALLGDVMLGRDVHPTPETFAYLQPSLTSADLALANLESPLTGEPVETGSAYALCAPPANVKYLADAGFDLLSLANNHRLDCGTKGLRETQTTLTNAGLGFIGPELEPVYRSVNGIQLAFLAFDATDRFDLEAAAKAVQSAQETGAIIVVSIHWGAEYQSGAATGQEQIAERLAEAGASLIWGHHPHVLQPAEWIHDRKTLVLYSLGNALFDQYGLDNTKQSALVLVTLGPQGVEKFEVIPFVINVPNSRIVEAGEREGQAIMEYFK